MEQSTHSYIAAAIMCVVLIVGLLITGGNSVSEADLRDVVRSELKTLNFPIPASAEDIASRITVPQVEIPEITIPEFKSDERVTDLWEDLYSEKISELEDNAVEDAIDELVNDDFEGLIEFLEIQVVLFDELDEPDDIDDIEDFEVEVKSLGLKEDEDKSAQVVFEIRVKYTLREGPDDTYKKDVIAVADVFYEDGEFDDPDVELIYAFA